jgi:uncharacterized protein YndB with AHSA1/START domain
MDFRVGGEWKHVMHGPDGANYPNSSVFREIVKPERIVYLNGGSREGGPGIHFVSTWTFEALEEQTRLTVHMVFDTPAERQLVVTEFGAIEGAEQTLARLSELLARIKADHPPLLLTRIFDAPRELLWQAWTDPEHVAQWWGPHGFTAPHCAWDAQPGKTILVHMLGPKGSAFDYIMPMGGEFLEVSAPERLVFLTNAMPDETGRPQLEVHNTVTFEEYSGKTRLTLQALIIKSTPAVAGPIAGMEQGWSQSLEKLFALLAK